MVCHHQPLRLPLELPAAHRPRDSNLLLLPWAGRTLCSDLPVMTPIAEGLMLSRTRYRPNNLGVSRPRLVQPHLTITAQAEVHSKILPMSAMGISRGQNFARRHPTAQAHLTIPRLPLRNLIRPQRRLLTIKTRPMGSSRIRISLLLPLCPLQNILNKQVPRHLEIKRTSTTMAIPATRP